MSKEQTYETRGERLMEDERVEVEEVMDACKKLVAGQASIDDLGKAVMVLFYGRQFRRGTTRKNARAEDFSSGEASNVAYGRAAARHNAK